FCQRRLTATPKLAVAWPVGVMRSSGSLVRFPTMVRLLVMVFPSFVFRFVVRVVVESDSPRRVRPAASTCAYPGRETRSRAEAWTGRGCGRTTAGHAALDQPPR